MLQARRPKWRGRQSQIEGRKSLGFEHFSIMCVQYTLLDSDCGLQLKHELNNSLFRRGSRPKGNLRKFQYFVPAGDHAISS